MIKPPIAIETVKRKITLDVALNNEPIVWELMNAIKFKEVARVATGGMHSSPSLLITYEGLDIDYHELGYIVRPGNYDYYFSIKHPNGSIFHSLKEFEADYDNQSKYEYKQLGQLNQSEQQLFEAIEKDQQYETFFEEDECAPDAKRFFNKQFEIYFNTSIENYIKGIIPIDQNDTLIYDIYPYRFINEIGRWIVQKQITQ